MSIVSAVVCDGCGKTGDHFGWPRKAHEVRTDLEKDHWVQQVRGQDFCPACVEAGKDKT
jgi:hypothetical protein